MSVRTYTLSLLGALAALLSSGTLDAQTVGTTANDVVRPYDGKFRPGINLTYIENPDWGSFNLAELAMGEPNKGIKGIGARTLRPGLFDKVLVDGGNSYDRVVSQYEYFKRLGASELTAIVGFPYYLNQTGESYCLDENDPNFGVSSEMFKGLYLPIWDGGANGTPYNDDNLFAKYLYETVSTYTEYVKFWEIWNEPGFYDGPNPRVFWDGKNYKDGWFYNDPNPCHYKLRAPIQQYVRTLRIAYEVIHAVSPDDYVTIAGLGSQSFLHAILRNTDNPKGGAVTAEFPLKAGAYIDVLGFHTYPHFDGSTVFGPTGYYERHSDGAADGIITRRLAGYKEILAEFGYGEGLEYPAKLHICTEVNVPREVFGTYNDGKPWFGGNIEQVNFIQKALVQLKLNDVWSMHTYSIADKTTEAAATSEFDLMGLYKNLDNQPKDQAVVNDEGIAYKTVADFITPTEYDPARTAALRTPTGVRAYAFAKADGSYVYMMWAETTEDLVEDVSAPYTFPAGIPLDGMKLHRWGYSYDGKSETVGRNVALTATPVYITASDADVVNAAPAPTLTSASSLVDGTFVVNVAFTEAVAGLTAADFRVSNGTASAFAGAAANYTLTVTPTAAGAVTVQLPAGAASDLEGAASTVSNLLTVTYSPADGGGGGNSDASDLALVARTSATRVTAGGRATFTLALDNSGTGAARGVRVAVTLPAGASVQTTNPSAGSYANGVWTVGDLAPGATVNLALVTTLTRVATATLYAQVAANTAADDDSTPGNGTCCRALEDDEAAVDVTVVAPVAQEADLSLALASTEVRIGADGTFPATVTVVNDGPNATEGVRIALTLSRGVAVVSSVVPSNTQYNVTTWTVNRLASGERRTLRLGLRSITPSDGATVSVEVTASSLDDPDSTPGNGVIGEDDTDVLAFEGATSARLADLSLALASPQAEFAAGDYVTFSATLRNDGNAESRDIVVQMPRPSGMSYTSARAAAGRYDWTSQRWTIPALAPGRTARVTLTYYALRATEPVTLFAQVMSASAADTDSRAGNRLCCAPEEDDEAALTLEAIRPASSGDGKPVIDSRPVRTSRPGQVGIINLTAADPVHIDGVSYDAGGTSAQVEVSTVLDRTEGTLVDALGRRVARYTLGEGAGTHRTDLGLERLAAGTYTLVVESPAGQQTVRVVAVQ